MLDHPKYQLSFRWRYLGLVVGGFVAFLRDPHQWIMGGLIDKAILPEWAF